MKKFEVVIMFVNIIIFGISGVVGNIISNTYYDGNRIVEYGICFGTLLLGLLVELSIHFALRKNLRISDKSQDVKKSNLPKKTRVIILSLSVMIIALIILVLLGCNSIIPLSTLGIILLLMCVLILSCICYVILYKNAK